MAMFPEQFPMFQPSMRIIAAISNSFPAVVTTTFNNQYLSGTIVRLYVPFGFGMVQANGLQGTIAVINPTQFSINIDTTFFDPFTIPIGANQEAQVVPIAEQNNILTAAVQNALPYQAS
jgi:hypothetical protein